MKFLLHFRIQLLYILCTFLIIVPISRSQSSPCGFPAPIIPIPINTLMNNTRLDYTAIPLPTFISNSPEECLEYCQNVTNCGWWYCVWVSI